MQPLLWLLTVSHCCNYCAIKCETSLGFNPVFSFPLVRRTEELFWMVLGWVMLKEVPFLWCVHWATREGYGYTEECHSFLTTLSKKKCVTCGTRDNCALIGEVLLFLLFWSGTDTEQPLKMSEGKREKILWQMCEVSFLRQSSTLIGRLSSCWQCVFLPCSSSFPFQIVVSLLVLYYA